MLQLQNFMFYETLDAPHIDSNLAKATINKNQTVVSNILVSIDYYLVRILILSNFNQVLTKYMIHKFHNTTKAQTT
jgi:hypothetical protein